MNNLSEKERTHPSFAAHFDDEVLLQAAFDVDVHSPTYSEHYCRLQSANPDWSFSMCMAAARYTIIKAAVELTRPESE